MDSEFKTFTSDTRTWRYKEAIDPKYGQPYYYAEYKDPGSTQWTDNLHQFVPDETKACGYRKSSRLMTFEYELAEYEQKVRDNIFKSSVKRGKRGKLSSRRPLMFHIEDDYKNAMLENELTMVSYINEAIRLKLVQDGYLDDINE